MILNIKKYDLSFLSAQEIKKLYELLNFDNGKYDKIDYMITCLSIEKDVKNIYEIVKYYQLKNKKLKNLLKNKNKIISILQYQIEKKE